MFNDRFGATAMTVMGRGCVKTQKHKIFVGRVTIADIEKIA